MDFLSGFVDLQVNGYAGVDFSSPDLSLAAVDETTRALYRRGTLAFCPTVITSPEQVYRQALPVLAQAMQAQSHPGGAEGRSRLCGIHLEGPFISPQEGAVGAHPRQYVRQPSLALFDELYTLAGGCIALLTLAPELPGAQDLIQHARAYGVTVSIGHTLANADQIMAAVEAGATLSTHLGNGCPNYIHRHHNPLWPQLAAQGLSAMLITDGHHLPPELIAVALAAKGAGRVIVTSDASPAAGCPPGEYTFFGTRALLEPSGRLRNLESDTLAGSSATLLDCMNHLSSLGRLDEAGLWQVGRDNPLRVLGLSSADLPVGVVAFTNNLFEIFNNPRKILPQMGTDEHG
jgi:N-acetylglucosamine-6-phosphate deacetylase